MTIQQQKGIVSNLRLVAAAQMFRFQRWIFEVAVGLWERMLVLEPLLPLHGGDAVTASCKSQTLHQFYSFLHLKDNTQLPLFLFPNDPASIAKG